MLLDAPKSARPRIYEKIETADMQKVDLEIDLSKLHIANKIRYTEAEIVAWLKLFCKGDLFDMEFRRRIIDTFINSVYLYDDRVVVFYNIRGGKQVSYIDMLDATEGFPGLDDEPAPADSAETPDAKKKPDTVSGVRLLNGMVEVTGFEPAASWSQTKRATNCATPRYFQQLREIPAAATFMIAYCPGTVKLFHPAEPGKPPIRAAFR